MTAPDQPSALAPTPTPAGLPAGPPALVVTPQHQHGVTLYAHLMASAVEDLTGRRLRVSSHELDPVPHPGPPARGHLHFTDRLWGASPEEAARRIEEIAAHTAITVTLHDLPQASDGDRNFARRRDCYRRVIAAAQGVVCNSRHESHLLLELVDPGAEAHVIPLPVDTHPDAAARVEPDGSVAVLGFYYPGKGHAEVVHAVERIRDDTGMQLRVAVLGRASAGHETDLDNLVARAARRGIEVEVAGYLDDAALVERCRRASVAVAAHRHFSASGSINTWIAAGRRPLVVDGRYTREVAERRPGTVTLVDPFELEAAIADAVAAPASTWLDEAAVTGPDTAAVASAYVSWWGGLQW